MKNRVRLILSALLFSLPLAGNAAEVRIYQMALRGEAPALPDFIKAMDVKSMPGLAVYDIPVREDGTVELDLTRGDTPAPDPEAKEPRRVGVTIQGELSPEKGAGPRIKLRIRECKHVAYVYGAGDKKFHPSLTESSAEVIGRFSKDGWCVFDLNPESKETRAVFVMRLTK